MVNMIGEYVGVKRVGKTSKKNEGLFVDVEQTENLGIIEYVGTLSNSDLKKGQKVYFGKDKEEIIIENESILIMKPSNIYAIKEETHNE